MATKTTDAKWALNAVANEMAVGDRALTQGELALALDCFACAVRYAEKGRAEVVGMMRAAGATWAEIGKVLNMSKQAAQQKFGGA